MQCSVFIFKYQYPIQFAEILIQIKVRFCIYILFTDLQEDLRLLFTLRFDCMAKQISWNPGEEGWLAICLNDGSLFICILNAKNEFILRTIEVNNARYAFKLATSLNRYFIIVDNVTILDACHGARKEM